MKNSNRTKIIITLIVITLFAIAMGHFEGVVVYYLRIILSPESPETLPLDLLPPNILRVEQSREIATLVMLATFAWLIGRSKIERIIIFLYTFAVWDIFYYISLYLMLGWPTSLTTIDVLFLIPSEEFWIAPVYVPIFISLITIIISIILLIKKPGN